jgi:methylenetetrahydrofolate dehydrogenase (NAD+)
MALRSFAFVWRPWVIEMSCRWSKQRPSSHLVTSLAYSLENHPPHENGLVCVSDLADSMRESVRSFAHSQAPNKICMVGILVDARPLRVDAEIYSDRIAETFEEDGLKYIFHRCPGKRPSEVELVIRKMNDRADVHGILVYYPVFKTQLRGPYLNKLTGVHYKTYDDYLRDLVSPEKDVEGLSRGYNARGLFRARGMNRMDGDVYVPCTALAVMKILERHHPSPLAMPGRSGRWHGCTITVVNRSEIMGRPLAALLALEGATVYSVDESSVVLFQEGGRMRRCGDMSLVECLKRSEIVVSGVPSPDFVLPSEAIAPGSTVVNVSEFSNVCEDALLRRPNVKLVRSVGKVTVAALEQNLVRLYQRALARSPSPSS